MHERVLVVDDDPGVRAAVRLALDRAGFAVTQCADGASALRAVAADPPPDLVVLDVNLPAVDGFDVLSAIRSASNLPVILLSGRDGVTDRVLGLELGADDYLVKPFHPRELVSRVRAVLRRFAQTTPDRLEFGSLAISEATREVWLAGVPVELTAREFELLTFLAHHPRRVFSRAELLEAVWHSTVEWQDPATVTEHIRRIRTKIEADRDNPRWIRTVRSAGYAFEP